MELHGLKYIAALPRHYDGPHKEFRRRLDLGHAAQGSKWIASTLFLLKSLVEEEFARTDLSAFNTFTSRITDPEPSGEDRGLTMTVVVTLCFIDPGG